MPTFQEIFGQVPTAAAEANGRVNLIGEHTDYNGGFVLPTPIPQRCRCELWPRTDNLARVWSANATGGVVEYRLTEEKPGRGWLDYIQGCSQMLRAEGHEVHGFELAIASEVPLGSGLSSSAALDVAVLRTLRTAFGLQIDDLQIAQLAQRVENHFVGAQVGIMDPLAASLGQTGMALFVDARELTWKHVPLPSEAELLVIDSGIKHDHAAGDYNTRRAECQQACQALGVSQLRELSSADLDRVVGLPKPLNQRARHVLTENERVLQAVVALEAGDLTRLGELFKASHASQRDDYAVSVREVDLLVELAEAEPAVYGARLTGGGFGGSIVALVHKGEAEDVASRVVASYRTRTGRQVTVLVPARSP